MLVDCVCSDTASDFWEERQRGREGGREKRHKSKLWLAVKLCIRIRDSLSMLSWKIEKKRKRCLVKKHYPVALIPGRPIWLINFKHVKREKKERRECSEADHSKQNMSDWDAYENIKQSVMRRQIREREKEKERERKTSLKIDTHWMHWKKDDFLTRFKVFY